MGIYKTPREVMQMTVAEIEVLSHHKPETDKKKRAMGLLDPEQAAFQNRLAYMSLAPREKIAKRMGERG